MWEMIPQGAYVGVSILIFDNGWSSLYHIIVISGYKRDSYIIDAKYADAILCATAADIKCWTTRAQ